MPHINHVAFYLIFQFLYIIILLRGEICDLWVGYSKHLSFRPQRRNL